MYRGFRRLPRFKWPGAAPRSLPLPGGCPCQGHPGRSGRPDMVMHSRGSLRTPGPHQPSTGNPGQGRAGQAARPAGCAGPVNALNCYDSLIAGRRRAGCASRPQVRPARVGAAAPRRSGPEPRPPPGRATARQCPDHGRPTRSSRTPDFRGVIARLLSIRGLQRIAAIHGTRCQATAVSGRRPIRLKTAWPRHVLPSPGITGTPRAPRIGRVRPRARAARAPSARCRPARAGPPAPRPRRVPGRAGRPGRRGP